MKLTRKSKESLLSSDGFTGIHNIAQRHSSIQSRTIILMEARPARSVGLDRQEHANVLDHKEPSISKMRVPLFPDR